MIKFKRTIILLFFFVVIISLSCEHDLITFETNGITELRNVGDFRTIYVTPVYDEGLAIFQTRDGGLLIAGSGNGTLAPADGTIERPQLTKLNRQGKIEWAKIYFEYENAYAPAALETGNGDFIMMINWFNQRSSVRLLKIDRFGNIIDPNFFERTESYSSRVADQPISKTFDGGFVLTGQNERLAGTFLTKIDGQGQVVWHKEFGREIGFANSVIEASDHSVMVVGLKDTDTEGYDVNVMLLKTDQHGNMRWTQTYGLNQTSEQGYSIAATNDGGFIIAGDRGTGGYSDVFLLKVDASGIEQWSTSFGGDLDDRAYSVLPTDDAGFILTGKSGLKVGLWKTDAQGNLQWSRLFGFESKTQEGNSITRLNNGEFAVTGATGPAEPNFGGANFDVFLLMADDQRLTAKAE